MAVHEYYSQTQYDIMYKNLYVTFLVLLFCSTISAQEQAKYRITYDCDAQIVTGKTDTYRWTLDIGDTTAVFYSKNSRLYNAELTKLKSDGDATALANQLPLLGQKYPGRNDLQIVIGFPCRGQYSYYKQVLNSNLKYNDTIPSIKWQLTDSTKNICEYECRQAVGYVYGRTWTVWFATDLPLNYGPYILKDLPGLILAAKDSDGLFDFKAVGIENAPEEAQVSAYEDSGYQKCSRKRFLKIRSESEGLDREQLIDRLLSQRSSGQNVIVYSIAGVEAKDNSKVEVPKYNHLDKE